MNDEAPLRQHKRKRLWLILAALVLLLAILFVPPFLSVSRYKAGITRLVSASLGRPVRLSSVEVRLLPRPGFVLTDLTVEEDPAYGAEPLLHANTVAASIRLLSLWRGRVELDSISVDEASLNLVRTSAGRWNLDSLLRTATAQNLPAAGGLGAGDSGKTVKLPYLEATNSRINIKNGAEKLPFSLIDAKVSLDRQSSGNWRIQMRGQPARTDLSLQQADTGVLRLDATLHSAPQLRQMPVILDLEWREAQLGQLTRLLMGTDAGWRGDLTGQLHLEGTAEEAQIKTRLRAIGVHREEFAPAAPMDFDANCTLVAHFSTRAIDNLLCDSPLGDGHIRLTGNLPGQGGQPSFSVELNHISAAAGLDALRTLRSGFAPELEAAGSASGKFTFAPDTQLQDVSGESAHRSHGHSTQAHSEAASPLTGSLTVESLQLSGRGLSQPILIPKLLFSPASASASSEIADQALEATAAVPAGGMIPLTISARLASSGYRITLHGAASISRGRELAHLAGLAHAELLDEMAGEPITVDLTAQGPWMLTQSEAPPLSEPPSLNSSDSLIGTVTLRNANWKADFLANAILISQATLHLNSGELRLDPVDFSYGPVKGTASLSLPAVCNTSQHCQPHFQLQFGALDAAVLQTAFLGAQEKSTMLSTLIERLRPTAAPPWPRLDGEVKAESLILGPVTLHNPAATISTLASGAEITALDAALLGGRVHGNGSYHAAVTVKDKPSYSFELQLDKLSPAAVGQLLGLRCTGKDFDGSGKIELTGFTSDDLAASAKGALHFEWLHGGIAASSGVVPPALIRFDRWNADAEIANGAFTLKENQIERGSKTASVQASVPFATPLKVNFTAAEVDKNKH